VWAASSVTEPRSPQYTEDANGRKSHHPNYFPVDPRPAPVESDSDFFRRHPGAAIRNRLPFENEFAAAVLEQGGLTAFVRITVVKRNAAGQPTRVARRLQFCEGGTA
jgi:hypothetical protein